MQVMVDDIVDEINNEIVTKSGLFIVLSYSFKLY